LNVLRGAPVPFRGRRGVRVFNDPTAPIAIPEKLRVVVWNVQYCAGIRQHFFYDGGRAVSTPEEEVVSTLGEIGRQIGELEPDVVMLQEVDRRSRRTAYVDQFQRLGDILKSKAGLTCGTSTAYWRVPYVPSPRHEHLGRVGMHLATFSRFQIQEATRWQLPLIRSDSRVKKLFNLRRCALDVSIDGRAFINTHLSAFSRGDGTLERQIETLQKDVLRGKDSWLLAGDFNSLAPWQSSQSLHLDYVEADLYPEGLSPVADLYLDYNSAFAQAPEKPAQGPDFFTYKPFTSPRPDRTIDHAFASQDFAFDGVRVVEPRRRRLRKDDDDDESGDPLFLSDHQPIQLDLSFRGEETETEELAASVLDALTLLA